MRFLIDTHVFLWWITGNRLLSDRAREIVTARSATIVMSVVVAWEVAIKARLGRLDVPADIHAFFAEEIALNGLDLLPVDLKHTLTVHDLPDHPNHKDPFDRLLAAQSITENLPLISKDEVFEGYGVERVW